MRAVRAQEPHTESLRLTKRTIVLVASILGLLCGVAYATIRNALHDATLQPDGLDRPLGCRTPKSCIIEVIK